MFVSIAAVPRLSRGNQNNDYCSVLSRVALRPGTYTDTTGWAYDPDQTARKIMLARRDLKTSVDSRALGIIHANAYIRELALQSQLLPSEKACDAACEKIAADKLSNAILSRVGLDSTEPAPKANPNAPKPPVLTTDQIQAVTEARGLLMTSFEVDQLAKQVGREINAKFVDPSRMKRLEDMFPKIRDLIVQKLRKTVADRDLAERLASKVESIGFRGNDCTMNFLWWQPTEGHVLVKNAFYDPSSHAFSYCNGLLIENTSAFQTAFVIAHEIGHSIDPCGITNGPRALAMKYSQPRDRAKSAKEFPFPGLISCLRDPKSIEASIRPEVLNFDPFSDPATFLLPPPAKKEVTTPAFCENDQITESFADWMASEVVPEFLEQNWPKLTQLEFRLGYANALRGSALLGGGPSFDWDVHPDSVNRIDRILAVSPKARAQMGCVEDPKPLIHCAVPEVR